MQTDESVADVAVELVINLTCHFNHTAATIMDLVLPKGRVEGDIICERVGMDRLYTLYVLILKDEYERRAKVLPLMPAQSGLSCQQHS